ncbi:MAG TPA: hypothetical protein VK977_01490 [Actinomycetota bacterium]|nr:hypothetical protein [Actinomycetota bacterium]
MAGLLVVTAFVLMSVPAMACPVTDLSCTVADPVTAVQDTVDQTTTTVEDTAATVNETVEPVTDAVKGVVGQVPDPPDPGLIDDPTGILPDVLGSTVTQPSGPGATKSGGIGTTNGTGGGNPRTAGSGGTPSFGRGPVIGPVAAPISFTPAVSQSIPRQGIFEGIGSLAIEAAKELAFPLALAVIVLLFVAVQNRIDRKDPKLALAPVAPDLLRFE